MGDTSRTKERHYGSKGRRGREHVGREKKKKGINVVV